MTGMPLVVKPNQTFDLRHIRVPGLTGQLLDVVRVRTLRHGTEAHWGQRVAPAKQWPPVHSPDFDDRGIATVYDAVYHGIWLGDSSQPFEDIGESHLTKPYRTVNLR